VDSNFDAEQDKKKIFIHVINDVKLSIAVTVNGLLMTKFPKEIPHYKISKTCAHPF